MSWMDEIRGEAGWSIQREREAIEALRYRAKLVSYRLEEICGPDEYDQA